MIVNYKYNFLFVHIQKTAGSSISSELFKIEGTEQCGNQHSFIQNFTGVHENLFKFCFVRNPWDRLVSWYNMMIVKGPHNNFSRYLLENSKNFSEFLNLSEVIYEKNPNEFIDNQPYQKSIAFNQLDYISNDDGKLMVDFIGRFESLQQDYNKILQILGINQGRLPHINKFNHEDYKKYYSSSDVDKVSKMYKRDIEFFNYKFE